MPRWLLATLLVSICLATTLYLYLRRGMEEARKEEARKKLLNVKVAVHYRYVTDGKVINRSLEEVIEILKEVKADFVFQGWLTQRPCPDKCSDLPPDARALCELRGYSYDHLRKAIIKIKEELPDIIFCGGTQAEFLYSDEVTGRDEGERRDKAWKMSLNPEKWGINLSRREMQCYWARRWGSVGLKEPCPSEEELKWRMEKYFPDLTNPEFQEVLLSRIYKQIDAGVDAIWIDMLYMQTYLLKGLTGDWNHPAVRDSLEAAHEIVERIHNYGMSKGKYIYVISWVGKVTRHGVEVIPSTNLDAGMVAPRLDEIKDNRTGEIGKFNELFWEELVNLAKERLGIPIFAMIDYGGPGRTDLYVFSQELSREEAREFLRKADEFFSEKGIIFIFPVHGGDMGRLGVEVKKLSYGRFNWYDSIAPEFQTFETIKELALKKTSARG